MSSAAKLVKVCIGAIGLWVIGYIMLSVVQWAFRNPLEGFSRGLAGAGLAIVMAVSVFGWLAFIADV